MLFFFFSRLKIFLKSWKNKNTTKQLLFVPVLWKILLLALRVSVASSTKLEKVLFVHISDKPHLTIWSTALLIIPWCCSCCISMQQLFNLSSCQHMPFCSEVFHIQIILVTFVEQRSYVVYLDLFAPIYTCSERETSLRFTVFDSTTAFLCSDNIFRNA